MALINFSREDFIEDVAKGRKHCTIRKFRKHPIEKGEKLYLYTGLRTSHSRKLRETVCTNVQEMVIEPMSKGMEFPIKVTVNGKAMTSAKLKQLTDKVGFTSPQDFYDYFKEHYTFPFYGQVIEWE